MIKKIEPVALAEVKGILSKIDTEKSKELAQFIKKFVKINPEKAKEMKKELQDLNFFSLKEEDIIKVIDFMPEDAEDLRKIFAGSELSLKQDEIVKILEIVKKYKSK